MTVVVSCVGSGPSQSVLLLGCADGAAAAAELLWPAESALGASATGTAHAGQCLEQNTGCRARHWADGCPGQITTACQSHSMALLYNDSAIT